MIEFRTLGMIDLLGVDATRSAELLRRNKRLALLAYLAMATPGGSHRRDSLLALFWPEVDGEHARGALRQSLHVIRGLLGAEVVQSRGDSVALDHATLRVDAIELARAVQERRFADALSLYRGDFLPAFFVAAAPDFDGWLEGERLRLRELALVAAGCATDEALQHDDRARALAMARAGVAIAPLHEPSTGRLLVALDRAGDRSGAISAYDEFARRLREEMGVEPSADTRAVIEAVRARKEPDARMLAERTERPAWHAPQAVAPASQVSESSRLKRSPLHRSARVAAAAVLTLTTLSLSGSPSRPAPAVAARVIPSVARDAYDRARYYLQKPNEDNLHRAVALFEAALDEEPLYPAAQAGLGDAFLRLGYGSYLAPRDAFPRALAAAARSIELDSLAPEPWATLGFARMYYDKDWHGAEDAFRRAIKLAPRYAQAHAWYAYLLTVMGRTGEARREVELAQQLAPLSVAIATDVGFVAFYSGRYADAREQLRGALLMDASAPAAHLWLGRIDQEEGKTDSALAEYAATGPLRAWVPTIAAEGYVHAMRGEQAAARAALARLDSVGHERYVTPYAVALVHAGLGERDSAFVWLARARADRTHWMVWLARDARWAPIRTDPRFGRLVAGLGLPMVR